MIVLAIKPMNFHSRMKWAPFQTILFFGQFGKIWENERSLDAFVPVRSPGPGLRVSCHPWRIRGFTFAVKWIREGLILGRQRFSLRLHAAFHRLGGHQDKLSAAKQNHGGEDVARRHQRGLSDAYSFPVHEPKER